MKAQTVKSKLYEDFVKNNVTNGDNATNKYNESEDLRVLAQATNAYKTAISALKVQLTYKKMTGNPGKIDFLEA